MKKTNTKKAKSQTDVPQEAATQNDPVKNLKRIVAKYDDCRMEAARHTQLLKDLEAEEKKLIENADPDDAARVKEISEIRIRKEMLSNKVAQFKAAAEEGINELGWECNALIDNLVNILNEKWSHCVLLIAENLKGFFYERQEVALKEAKEVCKTTNFCTQYNQLYEYLRSEGLRGKLPIFKAKALLEIFERVDYLTPVTPFHGKLFEPKTAEKHEDEELARLLTADGREELILSKIAQTQGRMTRETAEKSVDGRIKFLKEEHERRGLAQR